MIFSSKGKYFPVKDEFFKNGTDSNGLIKMVSPTFVCPECFGTDFYLGSGTDYKSFVFCSSRFCLSETQEATTGTLADRMRETPASRFKIDKQYKDATLANCNLPLEIQRPVSNWMKNPKDMLVMMSKPGRGKSLYVAAIINYLGEAGYEVYHVGGNEFFRRLRASIDLKGITPEDYIESIIDHEVFFFDDLTSENLTSWKKDMIHYMISQLVEKRIPTVLTTNFDYHNLGYHLEERTADRILAKENVIINFDTHIKHSLRQ